MTDWRRAGWRSVVRPHDGLVCPLTVIAVWLAQKFRVKSYGRESGYILHFFSHFDSAGILRPLSRSPISPSMAAFRITRIIIAPGALPRRMLTA